MAHVPKFGNWEGDNVPYTTYFDKARKGKATGRRLNPNDPEENPEAFQALASTLDNQNKQMPVRVANGNARPQIPPREQKVQKSVGSESDRSSADNSNQLPRAKPSQRKGSTDSSYTSSFASPITGPKSKNEENQMPQQQHHRAASIPKFGAWDETDPTSGEGFTVVFNKVKHEKHVAAASLPTIPQHEIKYSNNKTKQKNSLGLRSKICCCFH